MSINAILAHDDNYGIGKNGDLPWPRNDADLKWFRDCTGGHIVLMGRKTWESIGSKKLPRRKNFVITTSEVEGDPDGIYQGDILQIINTLRSEYPSLKIWIIGGAEIYKQALPLCDNIFLTHFKGEYDCDTFVPMKEYLRGYAEVAKKEQDKLTFSMWSRI